ncbi:MAG: CoA pyrophosphatase [Chitinophagales bacterium]|nr:CoA pyrophosphatase [Chitinophagales bacterium]
MVLFCLSIRFATMIYDKHFIQLLQSELQKPLPGEEAQYRMAPAYRPRLSKEDILRNEPRISGVLLLLYEKETELNIVFTQRKSYAGVHSGQMSFPGGKKEESDSSLVQTALRETEEEIGVEQNKIQLLGELSELYIPPSNFLVYPSVGYAENIELFKPQVQEVEKVVEIPLSFFLNKQNIVFEKEIKLFNGTVVKVPAYVFEEHVIWGATAIMLSEFTYIVEKATNENR